jgi:hypothetical protein
LRQQDLFGIGPTRMTTAPARLMEMLQDVVRAFLHAGVAHAIAGGMAVSAHGLPRGTRDVDFLIDNDDLQRAEAALQLLDPGSVKLLPSDR